jgi:hypothetical protein
MVDCLTLPEISRFARHHLECHWAPPASLLPGSKPNWRYHKLPHGRPIQFRFRVSFIIGPVPTGPSPGNEFERLQFELLLL